MVIYLHCCNKEEELVVFTWGSAGGDAGGAAGWPQGPRSAARGGAQRSTAGGLKPPPPTAPSPPPRSHGKLKGSDEALGVHSFIPDSYDLVSFDVLKFLAHTYTNKHAHSLTHKHWATHHHYRTSPQPLYFDSGSLACRSSGAAKSRWWFWAGEREQTVRSALLLWLNSPSFSIW